jgi:hypothetical protein
MSRTMIMLRERFFDATRAEDDKAGSRPHLAEHSDAPARSPAVCPIARHWVPGMDLTTPRRHAA